MFVSHSNFPFERQLSYFVFLVSAYYWDLFCISNLFPNFFPTASQLYLVERCLSLLGHPISVSPNSFLSVFRFFFWEIAVSLSQSANSIHNLFTIVFKKRWIRKSLIQFGPFDKLFLSRTTFLLPSFSFKIDESSLHLSVFSASQTTKNKKKCWIQHIYFPWKTWENNKRRQLAHP